MWPVKEKYFSSQPSNLGPFFFSHSLTVFCLFLLYSGYTVAGILCYRSSHHSCNFNLEAAGIDRTSEQQTMEPSADTSGWVTFIPTFCCIYTVKGLQGDFESPPSYVVARVSFLNLCTCIVLLVFSLAPYGSIICCLPLSGCDWIAVSEWILWWIGAIMFLSHSCDHERFFYLQDKISGQQACSLCLASTVHTVKVLKSRKLWRWLKVEVSHVGVCWNRIKQEFCTVK